MRRTIPRMTQAMPIRSVRRPARQNPKHAPRRRAAATTPRSRSHKMALIAGLAVATVLPNLFISNLIEERQQRQDGVLQELTRTWGPEQSLYTPTLVIPYQAGERPRQYVKIAPTRLDLGADLRPRSASAACSTPPSIPPRSTWPVRSSFRRNLVCANSSPTRMAGFSGARRRSPSVRRPASPGCAPPTTSRSTAMETQWQPCLEAVRQEAACKGAALVLANAPIAPAVTANTRIDLQGERSACAAPVRSMCSYGGKEIDAKVQRRHGRRRASPATRCRQFHRRGGRLRSEMADHRVRLAARHRHQHHHGSGDVERARPSAST